MKESSRLIVYMITTARILYAQHWKNPHIPTEEEWLVKISETQSLDILTASLRNDKAGFV